MDREVFDLDQSLKIRREKKISEADRHLKNKVNDDYINDSLWFGDKKVYSKSFNIIYKINDIVKGFILIFSTLIIVGLVSMFLNRNNITVLGRETDFYYRAFRLLSIYLIFIGLILFISRYIVPKNWYQMFINILTTLLSVAFLILLIANIPLNDGLPSIRDLGYYPSEGIIHYPLFAMIPGLPTSSYLYTIPFLSYIGYTTWGPTYLYTLVYLLIVTKLYKIKPFIITASIVEIISIGFVIYEIIIRF